MTQLGCAARVGRARSRERSAGTACGAVTIGPRGRGGDELRNVQGDRSRGLRSPGEAPRPEIHAPPETQQGRQHAMRVAR
jgi:hypothetical protein